MPALFDLDQLERFAAGPFDHHGTGVAERVGLAQERDPFGAQLASGRRLRWRQNFSSRLISSSAAAMRCW
jgi:hypothetical protein